MDVHGKPVLVTSGSSGIGLAVARILPAKGARVLITGRAPDLLAAATQALETAGCRVASVAADGATTNGRAAILTQALDAPGGLDILINNAGGVLAGQTSPSITQPPIDEQARIDPIWIALPRDCIGALNACMQWRLAGAIAHAPDR